MPKTVTQAEAKLDALKAILSSMDSAIVAYSGGIDSTFLMSVAKEVLGDKALAVTAHSASYSAHDQELAASQAEEMKLNGKHLTVITQENENPAYRKNASDRCYFCRAELMEKLTTIAEEKGIQNILLGAIADDVNDHRPGEAAALERGARFPLREAGLTKAEIREIARERGLSQWDRPAAPCLSSRIAYGLPVTEERLQMVEQAEDYLRALGLRQFRVRHHGELARIEVEPQEITRLASDQRDELAAVFHTLGFRYVTLDLDGYRTGSMNEVLPQGSESV